MWKFATTTNNPGCPHFARAFFARVAVVLLFFGGAVSPSFAQFLTDEAARETAARNAERADENKAKLEDLARIVENLRNRLGEMTQQQQAADLRLRELGGQIEELSAAVGAADWKSLETSAARAAQERARIAEDIAALNAKFDDVSEFVSPPPEKEFYESAFADYQRGEFKSAAAQFQKMLRYHPEGEYAANARYWISKIFLDAGDYEKAAESAAQLIALHSDGDKIPQAMLFLARAKKSLGQEEESRATLEQLVAKHPTTIAADEARHLLSSSP